MQRVSLKGSLKVNNKLGSNLNKCPSLCPLQDKLLFTGHVDDGAVGDFKARQIGVLPDNVVADGTWGN